MNNKAHLRPKEFDSNGDIIPMACKEEKGDLISREALKKELNSRVFQGDYTTTLLLSSFNDLIDNAPAVEAFTKDDMAGAYNEGYMCGSKEAEKARPQGEWIMQEGYDGDEYYECSICKDAFTLMCGTPKDNNYNFCPNCGEKMKGGAENE